MVKQSKATSYVPKLFDRIQSSQSGVQPYSDYVPFEASDPSLDEPRSKR